jgi:hypothetical protein
MPRFSDGGLALGVTASAEAVCLDCMWHRGRLDLRRFMAERTGEVPAVIVADR